MACGTAQVPPPRAQDLAQADGRLDALLRERESEAVPLNYVIAGGDALKIRVHQMQELTGEFRVSEDGTVTLPLLGPVELAGLTEPQASGKLSHLLEEYVKDPQVTVGVAEIHGSQVSIMGSVSRPGVYPIRGFDTTIADAITRAGGLTKDAGPALYFSPAAADAPEVGERREAAASLGLGASAPGLFAGSHPSLTIDLTPLSQGRSVPELLTPVRPGDMIVVPAAGEVFVDGWVNHPGALKLARGMTLTQAIASAGGMHFAASSGRVTLQRQTGEGGAKSYTLDYSAVANGATRDVYLENGDRIEVTSNPLKVVPWGMYSFLKGIVSFGITGNAPTVGAN